MTIHRPWVHSHNTFLTTTNNNFTLADKLNSHHLSALQAEAIIDTSVGPRAIAFELLQKPFHQEYLKQNQLVGEVKAATQIVNANFKNLATTAIKKWLHLITKVYPEGSDAYLRILPKGRKPFFTGIFTHRVASLYAFALSLSSEAAPLDALYASVANFIGVLSNDLQNQNNLQEKLKTSTAILEQLRFKTMTRMFADLGFFIDKYPSSPKDIERTFDLTSIRHFALSAEEAAEEYTLEILAGHQIEGGFPITPALKLLCNNLSPLPLKIYLSNSNDPDQLIPENCFSLAGDSHEELFISQIGDPSFRYIFIVNENSTINARLNLTIVS